MSAIPCDLGDLAALCATTSPLLSPSHRSRAISNCLIWDLSNAIFPSGLPDINRIGKHHEVERERKSCFPDSCNVLCVPSCPLWFKILVLRLWNRVLSNSIERAERYPA